MPTKDYKQLGGRTLLGEGLENGFPVPEVFEPDLLLKGKVHHLFNKAGGAKTWLGLYLAAQAIKRDQTVLYLDMENGARTVGERLQMLGVSLPKEKLDEIFVYFFQPELGKDHSLIAAYRNLLEMEQPDLIIFDSWINFLARCGLSEDNNTDVTNWSTWYLHPARKAGITSVVLDHVPHGEKRSRGASRKKDEVDVQWNVSTEPFNRKKIGEVNLKVEKDREAWLPANVAFRAGGSPFIFERTDAVTASVELTGNAKKLRDFLSDRGKKGAKYKELVTQLGGSKGNVTNALAVLEEQELLHHVNKGLYYLVEPESVPFLDSVEEEISA